jgi:hypothetical protein
VKAVAFLLVLVGLGWFCQASLACNIPVFRYALERWTSDDYEVIVFCQGADNRDAEGLSEFCEAVEKQSSVNEGPMNAKLVKIDVEKPMASEYESLWKAIQSHRGFRLPYVAVRLQTSNGRTVDAWHGPFETGLESQLIDSPLRRDLAKSMMKGHSIVWLILASGNQESDSQLKRQIAEQAKILETELQLPEGIGLPGSELYAEVPLVLKFSAMELDRNAEQEKLLVHMISNFHPDLAASGQAMIAPIFGRGRMLEVIPASQFTPELMRDLTMFMCGACSCQVKDRNPGVDLPLAFRWDTELFGESRRRPPKNPASPLATEPNFLTIPPGRAKK